MIYSINKVAIIGLGTLGAQIALQAALKGFAVSGYDPDGEALVSFFSSIPRPDAKAETAKHYDYEGWSASLSKIKLMDSLAEAVQDADIVIEVVPEELTLKREVWKQIDAHAARHALLATNSSSMPVSKLEDATQRPEMCLNIHVYHLLMGHGMADVMGGSQTSAEVLQAGQQFVRELGILPLSVKKELFGFCFNRIWRAIKREALHMWAGEFVDFRDIDRAYMVFNKTPWGPFGLMDNVGLDVIWDIEMVYYQESGDIRDRPPQLLKDKIESGHLGVKSGQGFYHYPDPEYLSPGFLKP